LAADMKKLLKTIDGIGLAAPQIGKNTRLCVVGYYYKDKDDNKKVKEDSPDIPELILINPEITWKTKKQIIEKEGCLSFPGIEYNIARPEKLHCRYINQQGKKQKIKARGLMARALMHEVDHLNGTLIKDRKIQ